MLDKGLDGSVEPVASDPDRVVYERFVIARGNSADARGHPVLACRVVGLVLVLYLFAVAHFTLVNT